MNGRETLTETRTYQAKTPRELERDAEYRKQIDAIRDQETFVKYDQEKPIFALIPPEFEEALAKILTHGKVKYTVNGIDGADNWKKCKTPFRTYYSALRRHLSAFARGDRADPDSGKSHLAHAACCLAFLFYFEKRGLLESQGAVAGSKGAGDVGAKEPGT